MMKFDTEYVEKGIDAYELRYRQQKMKWLAKVSGDRWLQNPSQSRVLQRAGIDALRATRDLVALFPSPVQFLGTPGAA
jgi:hypothetical protein